MRFIRQDVYLLLSSEFLVKNKNNLFVRIYVVEKLHFVTLIKLDDILKNPILLSKDEFFDELKRLNDMKQKEQFEYIDRRVNEIKKYQKRK